MSANNGKPILVTGTHRSGTTWTARMLAAAPELGYIWEPFNPLQRPGICAAPFGHWFTYVTRSNEAQYLDPLRRTLAFKFDYRSALGALSGLKDFARIPRDAMTFALFEYQKRRPLMKDPIALFSAEWLAARFDMPVVVLIRHPAAFTSSIVRYGMRHPFGDFLAQPELMHDQLAVFEDQIGAFAASERSLLDQGILLWNICHHVILRYREAHPEWTFLRHEDLAARPIARFEDLYGALGLHFSVKAREQILLSSAPSNPQEVGKSQLSVIRRDSRAQIFSWHQRLSPEEVARVRAGTQDLASKFYQEESWDPGGEVAWRHDSARLDKTRPLC